MKQKWLLSGIFILLACSITFMGYQFSKNSISGTHILVYEDKYLGLPLPQVISSCEQGGIECGMLFHERAYYQSNKLFNADFPEKQTIEKYLTLGCEALSLQACEALGGYYLEEKDMQKAWLPLAKACFGNNRGGCLWLDEQDHPPTNVSIDIKTTYGQLIYINPVDAVLIQSQQQFKECYSKHDVDVGMMRVEIVVNNTKAQARLLGTSLGEALTNCMLTQIAALAYPADIQTKIVRTFEYKWENLSLSKRHRN
jgi:hypothetical protein